MKEKLILVDCDGVLVDWVWAFDMWMAKHGFKKQTSSEYSMSIAYGLEDKDAYRYIKMFNETVYLRNIPAFKDAVKYIRKLHEDFGCVFHVITALSNDDALVDARKANLYSLFGKSPFYKVTCTDSGEPKSKYLNFYKDSGCIWVEDHVNNYEAGRDLGLDALLVDHPYNQEVQISDRVFNWKEIYGKYVSDNLH